MAKLTSAKRDKLPKKEFAEPSKKAYPIENKAHARDAKARASEEEHKGKLSKSEESKIDAKANKVLGEKGDKAKKPAKKK